MLWSVPAVTSPSQYTHSTVTDHPFFTCGFKFPNVDDDDDSFGRFFLLPLLMVMEKNVSKDSTLN